MLKRILALFLLSSTVTAFAQHPVKVFPGDSKLRYTGRLDPKKDSVEMYWSGSSVKLNFQGTEVRAVIKDQRADNFYNVIIDRDSIYRLKLDSVKKEYVLAKDLPEGKHSIELYKITEYDRGKTVFYGFELNQGAKVLPPPAMKKRKIEVYGNSITAGYGVEDTTGDSPASIYQNNYLSYAALTARHYDADYSFIAKSGIGITISWFPYTMPEVYDRLNPDDPKSKWDFSRFKPDIVVINLFQNDSWLTNNPAHAEFKRLFGTKRPTPEFLINAYADFVKTIRSKHPKANIICVLGNMDITREGSPWPGYVEAAVKRLNDKKIYTRFFLYKNTPGHPKIKEQEAMAADLIKFIDENIKW